MIKKIILASTSPWRKELMEKLRLPFEILPSDFIEDMTTKISPLELAKRLAYGKAEAVAVKTSDAVIVAADTIVVLGDEILGKPHTEEIALQMLKKLNNRSHSIITGLTVWDTTTKKIISRAEKTEVVFGNLTEEQLIKYVKSGEPLDKAGAYGIQGLGALLVKEVHGDFYTIMGLPLFSLAEMLREVGIEGL